MECKCNSCEQTKDIEDFYKNSKSKTGKPRQPCKDCVKLREASKRKEYKNSNKIIPEYKVCSVCNKEKYKDEFHNRCDTPTGLRSDCKDCYNLKGRKYYEDNSEKVNKRTSEYQKLHREDYSRRKRERYQADPESYREKDRDYREKNRDRLNEVARDRRKRNLEKYREKGKRYYHSNKCKMKRYRKKWTSKNKDKVAFYAAKRRANKKQATPEWADQEIIKSFYTEAQYLGESIDHIIPLSHPLVCGLHCEFNLQTLPLVDNIVKNNYFEICEHEIPDLLMEDIYEL